jgi:hypothetical protein
MTYYSGRPESYHRYRQLWKTRARADEEKERSGWRCPSAPNTPEGLDQRILVHLDPLSSFPRLHNPLPDISGTINSSWQVSTVHMFYPQAVLCTHGYQNNGQIPTPPLAVQELSSCPIQDKGLNVMYIRTSVHLPPDGTFSLLL